MGILTRNWPFIVYFLSVKHTADFPIQATTAKVNSGEERRTKDASLLSASPRVTLPTIVHYIALVASTATDPTALSLGSFSVTLCHSDMLPG